MRIVIIALLVILALVTILLPLFKKKKPSIFTAAIILIPAVALGYFEYSWTENQKELQESFREMTEVPIAKFSCERMSIEWFDAYVSQKATDTGERAQIKLKHSTCAPLIGYLNLEDKSKQTIDNNFTVALVAYSEAGVRMLNPGADSTKVRCTAVNNIPRALYSLGGNPKQAYLVQQYYNANIKNSKLTTQIC